MTPAVSLTAVTRHSNASRCTHSSRIQHQMRASRKAVAAKPNHVAQTVAISGFPATSTETASLVGGMVRLAVNKEEASSA